MTYLILNVVFLAVILVVLAVLKKFRWSLAMTWTMVILLVATAIFDSIIVGVGIVAYDEAKILGVRIGEAPIEDFFYAILAGVIIPTIWNWRVGSNGKD